MKTTLRGMDMSELKIGDLFQTSWGYDQTQYNFLKVVKISPSGKTCRCRMVKAVIVSTELQYDNRTASKNCFGPAFRMKVEQPTFKHSWNDKVTLRGSYPYLSNYQGDDERFLGSKRLDSFSRVEESRTYAQTNSQFGH